MNDLIRQGKICYWGTSHFPPETLTEYYRIADQLGLEGPHVEQSMHSMLVNHRARQALAPFIKNVQWASANRRQPPDLPLAPRSPLPDFFIGAHAAALAITLATADTDRYQTYFPDLQLLTP